MNDERKQILKMLAEGKIDTDQAERLLQALETSPVDEPAANADETPAHPKPKFLHIKVESNPGSGSQDNVDIKVPIMLMKAGLKLGSLVPEKLRGRFYSQLGDHGIDLDLNQLDSKSIDELIQALSERSIDIDADNDRVRIYCGQ